MPGSRYEDFKRNYAFSIYDFKLHGHPRHKKRCPWGHGIFYFGRPFLGFREKVLKRNTSILHFFTQSYPYLGQGGGVMKLTISCLLTLQILHTKFGWHCFLIRSRTTDNDGRQPIAIDHPSDSGDLQKKTLMTPSVCFDTINIVVRNWLGYGLI